MAKFEYVAKRRSGSEISSVITADTTDAAVELLHKEGLIVLSIRQSGPTLATRLSQDVPFLASRVSSFVIALFTRQLSAMIEVGLPLIRALHGLAKDEHDRRLSSVLSDVAAQIEGGETFSRALAGHPRIFSKLYVSLVQAGEESGSLATVMRQLSTYLERAEAMRRKVRTAMAYPIFVISFVVIASTVLFLKVVPMMANVYDKLGAELPKLTQVVIGMSRLLGQYLWVLFLLLAALWGIWIILRRSSAGRFFLDRRKLRIPIFGPILRKVVIAKFLRTLGVLVESGVPILQSLDLASGTAGNEVIHRAAKDIEDSVSRGSSLSAGFQRASVFPEIVVQMVSTGEETGTLGEMLSSMAGFYDEQVETAVSGLAAFIEPLMILLIGAVVALVVISTFLPIFYLSQAVRRGMMR